MTAINNPDRNILKIIGICVILPLIGFVLIETVLPSITWQSIQVHTMLESLGLFSGISLAIFILFLSRKETGPSYLIYVASAFLAMGILDGFHSTYPGGTAAGWFHTCAMISGGLLFSLVYFCNDKKYCKNSILAPIITIILAIILCAGFTIFQQFLPVMVENNQLTPIGTVTNFLAGFLFLIGAAALLSLYRQKTIDNKPLFFAAFCLLNATAAFITPMQPAWTLSFWFWHFLRVSAYILLFVLIFSIYRNEEIRAEQKIREEEEKFHTVADFTYDWEYWEGPDKNLIYVSPSCERISGYTVREYLENPELLLQIIHPDDITIFEEHQKQFSEIYFKNEVDFRIVRKDGEVRWIAHVCVPIHSPDKKYMGRRVSHRDITLRKQIQEDLILKNDELNAAYEQISGSEEELRNNYQQLKEKDDELQKSEQKFRAIFNNTFQLIGLLSVDGIVRDANNTALDFVGVQKDNVIGKPFWETPWVSYSIELQKKMMESIISAGKGDFVRFEGPVLSSDRIVHSIDFSLKPVINHAGEVVMIIPEGRDITEWKMEQDALEKATNKLNFLNSIVFHEIQNALFSLAGYLEVDSWEAVDNELRQCLGREMGIVKTITDFLTFANTFQNLGLKAPVWQNVMNSFIFGISHMDMSKLNRRLDVENLEIYADPLLENVFFSLAENVLLHGKGATDIALWYTEEPEGLFLIFEDNGIGIPSDLKEDIFTHTFNNKKGFGLFLTREILSITGITLTETGVFGKGARFKMVIPKNHYRFSTKIP